MVADESLEDLPGRDARDARLTSALSRLGLPADLVPLIEREQDTPRVNGSCTLRAPARAVRLTFLRADDDAWCLYSIMYGPGSPERPAHSALPLGLTFGLPQSEALARFGEPTIRAVLGAHRWERDDCTLVLDYDKECGVKRIHHVMSNRALHERVHGKDG